MAVRDYSNEKRETLCEILLNKRGSEEIKIDRITSATGVVYDIRRWYLDDDDEFKPTQKGVRMSAEVAKGVMKALSNEFGSSQIEEEEVEDDESPDEMNTGNSGGGVAGAYGDF